MNDPQLSVLFRRFVPLTFCCTTLALQGASTVSQVAQNAGDLAAEAAASTSLGEVFVWVAFGLLIGTVLGPLATRRGGGFGKVGNLTLGLAGAVLGGLLFDQLGIKLGLGEFVVNYDALLAAILGAVLLVILVIVVKSKLKRPQQPT